MIQKTLSLVLASFNFGSYNRLNYSNSIPFFTFLCSKTCKEPSVSSAFAMLSSVLDDVKGEGCRQSSARVRSVDKYKVKGVFKVNKGGNYKVEG